MKIWRVVSLSGLYRTLEILTSPITSEIKHGENVTFIIYSVRH
jgi:hypothetical protein